MTPRLLLVDDDQTFCEVMARALTRRGFEVCVEHGAEAALERAQRDTPSHALIDLNLGQESGLWLLPRLAALQARINIVVLTGYASVATAVEAIKLGATHYLAKPVDADDVVAAFTRHTGNPAAPVARQPLSIDRLEWEHIQRVLTQHSGNVSATARSLRMHRRTLQRKLAKRPVKR